MNISDRKTLLFTSLSVFFICTALSGTKFASQFRETTASFNGKLHKNEQTIYSVETKLKDTQSRLRKTESQYKDAHALVISLEKQVRNLTQERSESSFQIESLKTQLILSRKETMEVKKQLDTLKSRISTIENNHARTRSKNVALH